MLLAEQLHQWNHKQAVYLLSRENPWMLNSRGFVFCWFFFEKYWAILECYRNTFFYLSDRIQCNIVAEVNKHIGMCIVLHLGSHLTCLHKVNKHCTH